MPLGWYVVQPPTDGTFATVAKTPKAAMSGQQPEYGPMAATLKPYKMSMGGYVPTSGPVSAQIKKLVANFSKEYNTGTLESVAKKPSFASIGQIPFLGDLAVATQKPTISMGGAQKFEGAVASLMKPLTNAAFSGIQTQGGGMGATVKKPIINIAGDHSAAAGGIAAAIAKLQCAAVGTGPQEVQINSTGNGAIIDSVGNTRTINYGHVVTTGPGQRMYFYAACGHNTWVNPSMTISATVDGNAVSGITQVARVDYGNDSGNRLGHVVVWELIAPAAGTYSITITASASQGIHRLVGNSRVYNNTSGMDSVVTQAQTSTNGALNLSVTPNAGDMVFFCSGINDGGIGATFAPDVTPWYSGSLARTGDLDVWDVRDVLGTGVAISYTTSTTAQRVGAIGFIIRRS